MRPPGSLGGRVGYIGFVFGDGRNCLLAAARADVAPSGHEAFSRTVLGAWVAGTLVIGNAASAVVTWHCDRSGAGLTYGDDLELEQCLLFLAGAPEAAARLAGGGRSYVLEHYSFEAVMDRVEDCLERWTEAP